MPSRAWYADFVIVRAPDGGCVRRRVAADAALSDGWYIGWEVEGQFAGIGGSAQPFYRRIGQYGGVGNDGNAGKVGF